MSRFPVLLIIALSLGCKDKGSPSLEDARAFYAARPRMLQPVPFSEVPKGLPDMRAETCGLCHKEIYNEWKVSTHARAWLDDAQFQEELKKSSKPGRDVSWICVNCHTPMENQLKRLVGALKDDRMDAPVYVENPNFDPALQLDAITCGVCHIRDGIILGPYGDTNAPHPTKRDPNLLKSGVCTQCHQAKAHFEPIALACFFDTGREFLESPDRAEGKVCQSCHMPEVERPIATNGPPRKTRRHWFGGSLVPKKPEYEKELEPLLAHYPDGLELRWLSLPKSLKAKEAAALRFEIVNANAGHLLPTGDPERFLRVEANAHQAGALLAQEKTQIGSVYKWHPRVELVSDNRLKPRESRVYTLRFVPQKTGPVMLSLKASKWRISEENLTYHQLEGRYVAGRDFFNLEQKIEVLP